MTGGTGTITVYLQAWRAGDQEALTVLTGAIYAELRRLSAAVLNSRPGMDAVQPTELVHELYFQLPELRQLDFESRAHFFNLCARIMRNILVDHARKRHAARRSGQPVTLELNRGSADPATSLNVLLVNEALERLAEKYPRQAQVVELRFFGGLTTEETVEAMNAQGESISYRSVQRDWTFARAWLLDAIAGR